MKNHPTRPTLLGINTGDRPIRIAQLGTTHSGVVWVVQPGDEATSRTVDMINKYGGPSAWNVSEDPA